MTTEEIRQLAVDIYQNKVFTDRHIRGGDAKQLTMTFMALVFMGEKTRKELADSKPGMIYEYYDRAGPRSVNGYPVFFSFRVVNEVDAEKVWARYNKIKEAVAAASA